MAGWRALRRDSISKNISSMERPPQQISIVLQISLR
jgi:hypothetical protein